MSSDIDENQIDRPTISLSNLEKSTQSKKNTSTIDRKPSQLGEDQIKSNPLEIQRRLQKSFIVALAAGSICIFVFKKFWILEHCSLYSCNDQLRPLRTTLFEAFHR